MSDCKLRELSLESRLSDEDQRSFDSHVKECVSCQEFIGEWEKNSQLIDGFIEERSPKPTPAGTARLIETADGASRKPPMGRSLIWATSFGVIAAAALLAFGMFSLFSGVEEKKSLPVASQVQYKYELVYPKVHQSIRIGSDDTSIKGTEDGQVVRFQNSLLGMNETSELRVIASNKKENRFSLESGIIAAELPHVPNRETLYIQVRNLTVAVQGTIFWVHIATHKTVEIGVVRGRVVVENDQNDKWEIATGSKLTIPVHGQSHENTSSQSISTDERNRTRQLLHPGTMNQESLDSQDDVPVEKAREEQPVSDSGSNVYRSKQVVSTLAEIEQLVLHKNYAKAHVALGQRLKVTPNDKETLNLQATCYRKQGKYKQAVQVYKRLSRLGNLSSQNRARYRLSAIYQENLGEHNKAVSMLRNYLAAPAAARPNSPEARLRLAKSLGHLGRTAEYRQALQSVISAHPGTKAAQKAQQLLRSAQ